MPLPDIQLDDRSFESLYNELRRRIPVYTPEWTDHNESDPGITMLQLFAWLEEMIIWRLNRVPEKNYIKFLELVGIDLIAAAPAHAELTFTLVKGAAMTTVRKGTQVALSDGGDGPPVIFETDDNLVAAGVRLEAVQSFDGAQYTLERSPGQPAAPFEAFGATPQRDTDLLLGFDATFPPGQHRLTIHVASPLDLPTVRAGDPAALEVAPPVTAFWEYWAGDAKRWHRLRVERDETQALQRSGAVIFEAPQDAAKRKLGVLRKPEDPELYWFRYHIAEVLGEGYERAPRVEYLLLNTIGATNAVTVREELLGAANGLPTQTFRLANRPVLPMTVGRDGFIAVDEGDGEGFVVWKQVKDFNASSRTDRHYALNASTGVVTFGDGVNGKIPRWLSSNDTNRNDSDIANVKAVEYRWGGGGRGNAAAGTITSLMSGVPFIESVTNLHPSVGGQDEETVAEASVRAPMTLRTTNRAVTPEDFAFLATQAPGTQIRRAQAFPLLDPRFRMKRSSAGGESMAEVPIPGSLTVVIVPDSATNPKPVPNEGTLSAVAAWLDRHRLLTAELHVAGPRYRQIYVEGRVIAKPSADAGHVEAALRQRLLDYFHPLKGGARGQGWDFGGKVYFSETYRQILETEGVLRIESGSIKTFLDAEEQEACADVELEADELVYSTGHDLRVTYE
jgi:predicted phage baseplate assembly protein